MPANVRHLGHVYTHQHNAFNCTPLAVLNVARDSMANIGFSPATRVFEAAGAAACLITDAWEGIEQFLKPDEEVLVARDGQDVAEHVARLTPSAPARSARPRCAASSPSTPTPIAASRWTRSPRARVPPERARRSGRMKLVVLGLSLSSSWGNGHATTFRALLKAFAGARPRHPVPGARRALVRSTATADPDYCRLEFYRTWPASTAGAARSRAPTR
jgi:hypothetical protein